MVDDLTGAKSKAKKSKDTDFNTTPGGTLFYNSKVTYSFQGRAFVKKFDTRSRKFREFANELAFVFVFVFVKDGQPTSACVKGYQGVSYWRVR